MLYNNNYDRKIKRYLFPKQFYQMDKEVQIHLPINYLINLCLKNIHINPKKKLEENDINKKLSRLTKLISQFVYLYDTQQFSYMSDGMLNKVDNASFIHKYILYDHLFRFSQIGLQHRKYILNSLLKSSNLNKIQKKLHFSLDEYNSTVDKIYSLQGNGLIKIPKNIFSSKELYIIDSISHSNEINKEYTLPTDFNKVDNPYFLKPLIKKGEDYFLIDKCYSAWNFYEVILAVCRT